MAKLLDKVVTFQGDIMVTTETRWLFFFSKPRTSVTPIGFSQFGRRLGFQAVYRTTDRSILRELHKFWVAIIADGGFETYLMDAQAVVAEFPPEFQHLRGYILGFHG